MHSQSSLRHIRCCSASFYDWQSSGMDGISWQSPQPTTRKERETIKSLTALFCPLVHLPKVVSSSKDIMLQIWSRRLKQKTEAVKPKKETSSSCSSLLCFGSLWITTSHGLNQEKKRRWTNFLSSFSLEAKLVVLLLSCPKVEMMDSVEYGHIDRHERSLVWEIQ